MNKKLALLMFALGLGAASAPVFAVSCEYYCGISYRACQQTSTNPGEECTELYDNCVGSCP